MSDDTNKFPQVIAWVRAQMRERTKHDTSHPSHVAAKVLAECETKFDLCSYGVEGWARTMYSGVQYLNYGDSYAPTIVIVTGANHYRCSIAMGGWAPYA